MPTWSYIALCLVVPLVWGLASARAFDWWQQQHTHSATLLSAEDNMDMYHI